MTVKLFVQTGDARPKSVGRCQQNDMGGSASWHNLSGGLPGVWGRWRALNAQRTADRWWLVECENADAGRFIIARALHPDAMPQPFDTHVDGRILASGGRHARA